MRIAAAGRIATISGETDVCPECGEQVSAKVGDFNAPHWAHQRWSACTGAGERHWVGAWLQWALTNGGQLEPKRNRVSADILTADGEYIVLCTQPPDADTIYRKEAAFEGRMRWMYRVDDERFERLRNAGGLYKFHYMRGPKTPLLHTQPVTWHRGDGLLDVQRYWTDEVLTDWGGHQEWVERVYVQFEPLYEGGVPIRCSRWAPFDEQRSEEAINEMRKK